MCSVASVMPNSLRSRGIFQARVLEWVAITFSRGSSWLRDLTHISCFLYQQAGSLPLVPPGKPLSLQLKEKWSQPSPDKKSQATLVRYFVLSPYNEWYLTKVAWFCMVVWTLFGIACLWDWNENWSFAVLWLLLSFPKSRTCLSDSTTITKEVLCQSMCMCVLNHSVVSNSLQPHGL